MSTKRTNKRFPEDYVIETLRGSEVPDSNRVLRAFADRASRVVREIESYRDRARDPKAGYLVAELAAIAVAVELVDKRRLENIEKYQTPRDNRVIHTRQTSRMTDSELQEIRDRLQHLSPSPASAVVAHADIAALREEVSALRLSEASWQKEAERHERDHRDHYEERERLRVEIEALQEKCSVVMENLRQTRLKLAAQTSLEALVALQREQGGPASPPLVRSHVKARSFSQDRGTVRIELPGQVAEVDPANTQMLMAIVLTAIRVTGTPAEIGAARTTCRAMLGGDP